MVSFELNIQKPSPYVVKAFESSYKDLYDTSIMFCFENAVLKNKPFMKFSLNLRMTAQIHKLARLELTGLKIANSKVKTIQKL